MYWRGAYSTDGRWIKRPHVNDQIGFAEYFKSIQLSDFLFELGRADIAFRVRTNTFLIEHKPFARTGDAHKAAGQIGTYAYSFFRKTGTRAGKVVSFSHEIDDFWRARFADENISVLIIRGGVPVLVNEVVGHDALAEIFAVDLSSIIEVAA